MTSRHGVERKFPGGPDAVQAAIRYALRRVELDYEEWEGNTVTVRFTSAWSGQPFFGRRVTISWEDDGEVHILGGKKNVRCILAWMEEYFELWYKEQ